MRPSLSLLMVALALLSITGAGAEDSYPIYVYPVPQITGGLQIDGQLTEPQWSQAALVSGFTIYGSNNLAAPVQTAFRVLYDSQHLYVGVLCQEPAMARLVPIAHPRDEHAIFGSESVEVFVDPAHTHDIYYQLAANAAGSLYDGLRTDISWNSQTRTAAAAGEASWSLEMAIPWTCLGVAPRAGAVLGFNVTRNRTIGEDRQWSMWSRVRHGFHDPERFGHLVLAGTPEMIGRLGPELRKGDRSGPITVFSPEGFAQTTYRQLAAQSLKALDQLLADLDAEQKREKDAATAAEMGKRLTEFRQRLATYRQQVEGNLDALEWTKLDFDLQQLSLQLTRLVAEARLTALLSQI